MTLPEPEPAKPAGENIPLNIVYEDDDLIVIDKPAGLVVHPAAGHASGTLVNALIAHCGDSLSGIGGVKRPGIVHRLDKDTTGLMVVAKNDRAHQALSAQFAEQGRGRPAQARLSRFRLGRAGCGRRGTIDAPLGRHPDARDKRAVRTGGREAVTHWQVLETYAGKDGKNPNLPVASLLDCRLETGRTHQIRVHLAHIGHPLLGDETYATGYRTKSARLGEDAQTALAALGRQALHAYLLAVEHPTTGERLEFQSELPGDLARLRSHTRERRAICVSGENQAVTKASALGDGSRRRVSSRLVWPFADPVCCTCDQHFAVAQQCAVGSGSGGTSRLPILGGKMEGAVMARSATLPALKAESGLAHYLDEIRRFPMLEPQEEYMLAKRWREHGDTEAAHKLVTSHLRLVAKIAMGYRGYGLPISEVVSEGNVGLMQAVKRFEPEKGFRLATYAMWWISASIQEYILRSWSLVKMGTTANQKKLFFNLRKAKSKINALDEGDLRPDQTKLIAKRLGVTEQDVVDMNRRLGGDASLNAPIRDDGDSGEWQDWLVDNSPSQQDVLEAERAARQSPQGADPGARRAQRARTAHLRGATARRRSDHARGPRRPSSASRASACARSRCAHSRRCRRR